jgi:mRNA interferase RelE/StbE
VYRVRLAKRAARFFDRASAPLQRKLDCCFDQLKIDPRDPPNIRRLTGQWAGLYRYRVGDHRVIYRIDEVNV